MKLINRHNELQKEMDEIQDKMNEMKDEIVAHLLSLSHEDMMKQYRLMENSVVKLYVFNDLDELGKFENE